MAGGCGVTYWHVAALVVIVWFAVAAGVVWMGIRWGDRKVRRETRWMRERGE